MKKILAALALCASVASAYAEETSIATPYGFEPMLILSEPMPIFAPVEDAMVCTMDYAPVCGVDAVTYGNACGAGKTKIAHSGECDAYVDPALYAVLGRLMEKSVQSHIAKSNVAKLVSVLSSIDVRIDMVKKSRIAREVQVRKITTYLVVKNAILENLAKR